MKKFIYSVFLLLITVVSFAQSVTVTQPNGGEILYACQQYTVKWNATGTSNYYNIDYSLNNGAIWTSVASNLNITNGQYVWTVPNVESSTCLIRVQDKNDTTKQDISNAVFTIHIPVVVTAPNGGESWVGGSQHPITWNIQGTSLTFNIEYSTNGGSSWSTIVSNFSTSAGTYNWTVPNIPSANCLVRVTDAVTGCMTDVSNNPFTITPAQPVLITPNGGENYNWDCNLNITWNAATFYSNVRLEYSLDSGLTWQLISTGVTNSGSYTWTVPQTITGKMLIKASNSSNTALYDISNAVFNILRPVTITSPNGGEVLRGCDANNFTFTKTTCLSGSYLAYYSIDNGATWTVLGSSSSSSANVTIAWTIPNSVTSTQCLVRVYNTSYPAAADTSNAVFTIQPNNAITVTAPNGGEVIPALSNYVITWTNTAGASGTYNIEYSSNNGSTWSTLATNISGNTYNWTNIPNVPSTTYLVRVSDYANTCRNDVSNATFTVTPAQPVLYSPNGGETYNWDCNLNITWNAATFYSNVRLDYSLDSGLTWILISSGVSNSGSYTWTVPQTITGKMLIKASNSSNVNLNDVSNAVFSILRPVTITSPNGGEVLRGCDANNFTFTKTTCLSGSYLAYYSTDNGANWNVLGSSSSSSANVTIAWTVPNTVSSTQCLVRVYNTSYPAAADTSNAVFTIQPNNVVTVTSPNGGEVIPALSNYTITWSNTAGASGTYNVEYSSNNGSTWSTLATNISGNTYNWTNIPNVPSTTYLVRVSDYANTCRNDVSNATFTVTPAQPVLISPNGGESFNWDCNLNITWNAATFYSNVRLDYSLDSGLTWQLISTGVSNSGSYTWTVPQTITGKMLIKASNTSNLSLYDISNAVFNILRPVTITSPNGGEVLRGCDANNFTFTKTTCLSGSYLAYYSIDNGATWTVLGSSSSSSANVTIAWTIPNSVTSTQCLVRVYNTSYPAAADTSNAVFTIQPNNVVTVTSPNGGEVIPALSNYVITWTNTAGASGTYNVEYSSNNGSTWSTLATNISGNTYNWTNIPNVPSTTYLIRVSDYANTCRNDVSNATFTVTPAQPVLVSPNGGENYNWDCNLNITWNAATFYSNVRLDYSLDSGLTWQLISTGVSNSGSYTWTVPQTITGKMLIKASNSSNLSLYDISNAVFNILRPVTITSPNGGEVLRGCDANNFTFTKTTCLSGSYLAYYSTDNGANWNVLGSSSSSSANVTIAWTVPNTVSSTQCLVRVYNTSYPAAADTSNAVFTIQPNNVVTVISPNGGEVLPALSNTVITWTNTAGASGTYNVEYSSNNGSTWSTLATNISGNTYNWTNIPNVPTTTYLVRVSDYANTCRNDVSNATFTVTPAQPVLVTPNGGETYNWDCNLTIVWNAATFYSSVRLDYSLDSGLTWQLISTGVTNSGSYTWTVPQTITGKMLIKASNTSNLSLYDISNATFSILRPVRITSPNGGEVLLGCDANNFTFTKTTCLSGSYLAYYSIDSGATWTVLGASSSSSANVTIAWTIPNSVTSTQCLVRVYNTSYPAAADTSNAVFTIQPNNVITVTSPNGGEVLPALGNYTITWTNTAGASGTYNVEYSSNNGSTWSTLATNISGNTYSWTNIPNIPSTTYLIRVSDYANTCRYDVSNATFTITPAQPILVSPNGGESLWSSSSYTIVWNAATFYSPVRLEYSLDNGLSWQVITTSTTNNGSYSWTVPNANSTTCLVKASNTANINLNDVSNSVFTIKPAVRVFTPNGLDQLGACTQTSITFDHTPAYTAYNIEYSINNGSTWTTLVSNQTYNGTTGTYSWSVPNIPTTQARVRVYPTGYNSLADVSDTTFTIKRAVTIIQPNFGGVLQVGTSYPIIWSSDGISNLYDLAYSTNGGTSWTNIILGYNTATNTYNWTVPNTPSSNCLIRIRDNINSCKEDISDIAFTISSTAAPITITNPNGQDTLLGCQNYTIRWTGESGTPLGSYTLDYTTDGGISWLPVVSNYATTAGTYNWVVPNINTTTALIRVASSANNTIFDLSNAAFNIFNRSVVAGPDTVICTGNQVQLSATGGTGTFSWSPSATLSNANIANPIATPSATINYVVSSGNGTCIMRDTATITVLNGSTTNVGVTIAASPSAAVCLGNQILFTATPANGGTNPVYQWKKNGNNAGSNSANYILNPATNNDVISCVLTSNAACATNNPATSNLVTVTVFPTVSPTVTIATAATTVCAAQSVTFTAAATNGGNAPAYQWKINGNNTGTNSATFTTTTLANNDVVTCVLTSNAACVNNATASSNALLITVTPSVVPSVSITTAATTVCNGSSVTFTATPVNGGTTPAYQWKINGNNAGANSATFTTTALNNNDVVTCVLTSNANCALPATATSNGVTMLVTGSVVPSVTVNASATTICAGGSVTFAATPVNGGTTPAYQWRVNNTNAGTNSNTFTSTSLNNNDTVRVILTSSSGCAIPTTGTSAPVVIAVNPTVAPAVSISGNNSICAGTATTFTATATNAGSSPVYQWKVNNTNSGSNSSTFTTSTLANADSVYCVVTSSSGCATPNTATSNKITITVAPVAVPTLSIATTTNSICSGANTVFTATATNAGSNPVYQWKINGNNVGVNSASYSSTTLANNDVVTCVLTSSATCAQPVTATSNAITMSVGTTAAPAIGISSSTTNICSGASAAFTAAVTNGGANPVYQWKVNGNNAGTNNATFITSTLANNDVVTCIVTSSALCATPATVTSNAITVAVGITVTPTITITANNTTVCSGTSVTFTANPLGGGATPVYQWKVNGNNAGTNSATFTTNTLANNDVVTCALTSAAACAAPATVTSNGITVTVNTTATPTVSISANNTTVCAGTPIIFTAATTNGGNLPGYQWKVNGNNAGSNQASFTLTNTANGDVVTCQLTSSQLCATPVAVSSNSVTLSVSASVTPAVSIAASSTNICSGPITFTASAVNEGTTPVYQWKVNGNNAGANSAIFTTSTLGNNDVVSCVLASNAGCATTNTATSNSITVTGSTATPVAIVSASSNAICSGAPVTFTVSVTNAGTSQAYQWKVNGANVGGNSNTYTTTAITATDSVSCLVTVTSSCSGTLVATSNKVGVQITPSVNTAVSIAATATSICQGTAVTFTATGTNAGTTPAYQWFVNGVPTGNNSNQFISSTLNTSDTVSCRMSSSVACASPATVASNSIVVQVTPAAVPTVTISPSAVSVCQGSNVTFTATTVNGGANPAYQWKLNNASTGNNSATYSNNSLVANDVVYCEVTSSAACAQPALVNSNAVTVNITTPATPAVSITASTTNICNGQTITFTATGTNGGNAPVYAWFVNGNSAGSTTNTFTSSTLANGDVVSCGLTSNATCVTTTTALSNIITISSGTPVTPAVTINASATAICTGTTVTFTANAVNGGATPVYQWLVNGNTEGSNSSVFASSALGDGDIVTCVLTSNAGCITTNTATASSITITVTNGLQPAADVTASADSICAGSTVTFTATAVNAGNSPFYQWLVNNNPVSSTNNTYSSNTLTSSDMVTCVVISNAGCSNGTTVTSAPVSVLVNPVVTPSVSVSTANTTICTGQNTIFTATPVNGGSTPAYQWLVNGNNTGGNSPVFATATLNNSDVVTVRITSNVGCVSSPGAVSAPVTMVVNNNVPAAVAISSIPADTICAGTTIVFTAAPVNGGTTPVYQWKLNGNTTGSNTVTYSNNSLNDGDIVQVEMTSSATCVNQATVISAGKVITVNSLPAVPVISQSGNVLTSGAPAGNQWYTSSQPISGATSQSYIANNSAWYSVAVTDANGCSSTSDSVYVQYTGINDIDWSTAISVWPNPFTQVFKVTVNTDVLTHSDWTITVTDALGRVVYEKNNIVQQNTIDFTHRAAGVYVVSLKNGSTIRSYKIVKQ